jgi:hypothetical protein
VRSGMAHEPGRVDCEAHLHASCYKLAGSVERLPKVEVGVLRDPERDGLGQRVDDGIARVNQDALRLRERYP